MERLYEIRDELKQLDFHSYNSLGVVEQYFRCRLWVDLSRACFNRRMRRVGDNCFHFYFKSKIHAKCY